MQKKKTISTTGPIAEKFIRSARQDVNRKIINLNDWKSSKLSIDASEQAHEEKALLHLDPLHALYANMQHRIVDFIELFSTLPESRKLNNSFEKAEDIYMPSAPPMSPITRSYFTCWSTFDLCVGIKRETYATIMTDFCKAFGAEDNFLRLLQSMQQSRMGLYIVESNDDKFVYLRELYTNKEFKTHSPSGYLGAPGEIWLVRLFSEPTGQYCDYSVAFTTPYVIIDIPINKSAPVNFSDILYSESDWLAFIERNVATTKHTNRQKAYEHLMKYGLSQTYWLEYIFLAYIHHTSDVIFLTGFPDKPESLPHA